jgi:hypothetical protein
MGRSLEESMSGPQMNSVKRATPLDPDTRAPLVIQKAPVPAPQMPPRPEGIDTKGQFSGDMSAEDHQFIQLLMGTAEGRNYVASYLGISSHDLDSMFFPSGKLTKAAFKEEFREARTALGLLHRWMEASHMASRSVPIDPKASRQDRFEAIIRRASAARSIFKESFDAFHPPESRAFP